MEKVFKIRQVQNRIDIELACETQEDFSDGELKDDVDDKEDDEEIDFSAMNKVIASGKKRKNTMMDLN
jgi:hypothetical protein